MQTATSVLLLAALCACVPKRDAPPAAYRLDIQDEPALQRFRLVLASQDSRALCLEGDAWPAGHWGGDPMFLVSGAQSFSRPGKLMLTDSDYCPGGCPQLEVPPKGTLEAIIPYEDFGEPQQIAALPNRELQFSVYVSACRH